MVALKDFLNLPFKTHILLGCLIRVVLILYGDYHDDNYDVPYTDVDYKVFTDAARHIVHGNSPYKRHTYRYSPIVAFLMIPNILICKNFGKILFCLFDILITVATKAIVRENLTKTASMKVKSSSLNVALEKISIYSSLCWLYNPLSIAISTRGNADSVPCFLIILSILFIQTDIVKGLSKYAMSGMLLGASIHLRLYPLAFSFPMYLSLGDYKINRRTRVSVAFRALIPNKNQIALALSCITSLFLLTFGMYRLYGYEFLFETYIYHLFRKDTRHNFSVMFYHSYLTSGDVTFDIVKTLVQMFEFVILFMLSLSFGTSSETLSFGLFAQAVVMVAYNSVMTSQYFVWFLSLLPLVAHDLMVKPGKAVIWALMWGVAQGAWLFYAYLLEFKSREVFPLIWLKGVVFFCTNVYVLGELIKSYRPGNGYRHISDSAQKCKSN